MGRLAKVERRVYEVAHYLRGHVLVRLPAHSDVFIDEQELHDITLSIVSDGIETRLHVSVGPPQECHDGWELGSSVLPFAAASSIFISYGARFQKRPRIKSKNDKIQHTDKYVIFCLFLHSHMFL